MRENANGGSLDGFTLENFQALGLCHMAQMCQSTHKGGNLSQS